MTSHRHGHKPRPAFKETQIFDWASEPAEERPSEFGHSTSFATMSGSLDRQPKQRKSGIPLLLIATIVVGVAIVALMLMKQVLRG